MNNRDQIRKFWIENYDENLDDNSHWITLSEAYRRFKEYSLGTEIEERIFHHLSTSYVKTTKKKSPVHGERLYKVKLIVPGCSREENQEVW